MTSADVLPLLKDLGLPVILVVLIAYVLLMPDKVQKIAGGVWALIGRIFGRADRKAVALRVQGEINSARAALTRAAPRNVIEGKLKLNWHDAEEAQAVVRDGDVVVFMRRSQHHEENVAHALMAFLPKAVLPRARRYLDKPTMRAADLTIAKALLGEEPASPGAMDFFYDQHLDPACDHEDMKARLSEMDEIDLHGWLLRVLLPEFRHLGDELFPGEASAACVADSEAFARWLHRLAARDPGDDSIPLAFKGRFLRIAVVLVANRYKLADQGPEPYRRKAKQLLYSGEYDAVYLMARDDNIPAVLTIVDRLRSDGRVLTSAIHEYELRRDFKRRKLHRERAVVAMLRSRGRPATDAQADDAPLVVDTLDDPDSNVSASAYVEAA